jgi:prolyl 4-hydroxylase
MDEQDYLYGTSRLPHGSSIKTAGREVRVLARAEKPTLALLGGLLSPEECTQLIELARPRLQPSTIVDPATGKDVVADHRSSYGMFFRLQETPFIAGIDRRISEVMNLPVENGEGLQILHYPAGAESALHFDFLVPSNPANQQSIVRSGQRVSTLVSYLNDVESGGETIFPEVGWSVIPRQGNSVYFEYCNDHNQLDHLSLHGSAVVLSGEKWVASKWMRQRRFVSAGSH